MYPESGIRPKIWRTWLPDIFLNPHGYPSHEWVQLFSEYAAWVRTRVGRDARLLDDARLVDARVRLARRCAVSAAQGRADEAARDDHRVREGRCPARSRSTTRAYDRYKRYSFDFDQKNFKLDFTNGVLIYKSIKGARANPQSPDFMTRKPNVTIWDGVTEAPDETARGDWMKLVANAGLQWDKAILDYLVAGPPRDRAQGRSVLERRQPVDEPAAAAEAGEGRRGEETDDGGTVGR